MRGRLILGILMMVLGTAMLSAKTFVVCIGINDYPGTRNDLKQCVTDARAIHGIFKSNDAACRRALLTDGKATVQRVVSTIASTFADATPADAAIVYFSGHGVPGALCCADGFLSYKDIYALLKQCNAGRKMVLADACFTGKMRTSSRHDTHYYNKENVMLFLSSRGNESSIESNRAGTKRYSMFTRYLERGLRGGADANRDGCITARELYDFVHKGVVRDSRDRQHPVMWGNFESTMPVITWNVNKKTK